MMDVVKVCDAMRCVCATDGRRTQQSMVDRHADAQDATTVFADFNDNVLTADGHEKTGSFQWWKMRQRPTVDRHAAVR